MKSLVKGQGESGSKGTLRKIKIVDDRGIESLKITELEP